MQSVRHLPGSPGLHVMWQTGIEACNLLLLRFTGKQEQQRITGIKQKAIPLQTNSFSTSTSTQGEN